MTERTAYALHLNDLTNALDLNPVQDVRHAVAPYEIGWGFADDGTPLTVLRAMDAAEFAALRAALVVATPVPLRFYRCVAEHWVAVAVPRRSPDQVTAVARLRHAATAGVPGAAAILQAMARVDAALALVSIAGETPDYAALSAALYETGGV